MELADNQELCLLEEYFTDTYHLNFFKIFKNKLNNLYFKEQCTQIPTHSLAVASTLCTQAVTDPGSACGTSHPLGDGPWAREGTMKNSLLKVWIYPP